MRNGGSNYMRLGALALGATVALGACAKKDRTAADTAAVSTTTTTPAGGAAATTDTAMRGGAATTMGSLSDANILALISMANSNEIGTAKLAEQKATNADVKSFARDMIKDHTAMQADADKVARQLKITPEPPPGLGDEMKRKAMAMTDSLKAAPKGSAFDRQYINDQVAAHQETLDQLQQFQTTSQNVQIKELVTKSLPKVQQHLDRAKQIQGALATRA